MKEKLIYQAPEVEQVEIKIESTILDGSLNGTRNAYSVDAEEEWS